MRLTDAVWGAISPRISTPGELNIRKWRQNDISSTSWVMLNRKHERITLMHFPFSSNISELSECELVVGKVGTMFPFIYIQCEEQREERREGAWQIVGRAFPVSSIQTCQVHSNIDSAHQFKLSEHFQKVIEPLTSSHHQSCWWCESKTLRRWVCQVCVNIPHFVLHQNFFSSAPTWCRAAAYIIIPPCTVRTSPSMGEDE